MGKQINTIVEIFVVSYLITLDHTRRQIEFAYQMNMFDTAQKKKFSVKDFFGLCERIARNCGFVHIYQKKYFTEKFCFYAL